MIKVTECDHYEDGYEPRTVWLQPTAIVRMYQRPTSIGALTHYTRIETGGAHFNVDETPEEILRAIGSAQEPSE